MKSPTTPDSKWQPLRTCKADGSKVYAEILVHKVGGRTSTTYVSVPGASPIRYL